MLTLPGRFNGPPHSANGGYAAGRFATLVDGPVRVALRTPPPLDVELDVAEVDDGVDVVHGDATVVGQVRSTAPVADAVPATPDLDTARRAMADFPGLHDHPFATCFVCGPRRPAGDGLELFPGPVAVGAHVNLHASAWTPAPDLGADVVDEAFVWAALDCPSYFGGSDGRPGVLASLAVTSLAPIPIGEEAVVLGWRREIDGRKIRAGSAVTSADGQVLAVGEALWIALDEDAMARMLRS